jgi:hypothetical protein
LRLFRPELLVYRMNTQVNTKVLMFGAWAALLYPGLLCLGWWLAAGFMPPHPPSLNSEAVAAIYQRDASSIRLGMVITMFGAAMFLPLGATVAFFISRIEGFFGPLSILQVMGTICAAVLTFYPPMWWLIAAFRPERSAELTAMLNDAGWLQWVGGLTIYYPSIVSISIAAFMDRSVYPVFPRWFGYANLWLFLLLLPGQLIFFFKMGPFAWNGLIAFYLAFSAFAAWFPVTFFLLRKAIRGLEAPQSPTGQP